MVKTLDRVAAHAEIEGPVIRHAPLILHPKLLSGLDVVSGRLAGHNRPCRYPAARLKGKNLRLIIRSGVVQLKSGLDYMAAVGNPGVIEARAAAMRHTPLVRRLCLVDVVNVRQSIEGIGLEVGDTPPNVQT